MGDEILLARLEELGKRSLYTGQVAFSRFLDLAGLSEVHKVAHSLNVPVRTYGGYHDAERRIAAFGVEEVTDAFPWPIVPLKLSWRTQFGTPGHRDILGALMGLGFEREMIGDIVLSESWACLFAEETMADYIAVSLTSCGRVSVRCERMDSVPDLPPPAGRTVRETVSSLRLDAVLAAALSLSRSEAARYIASGRVFVDQSQTLKTDAGLKEGQIISIRGSGRIRLERVEGETRKGRLAIRVFLYGTGK